MTAENRRLRENGDSDHALISSLKSEIDRLTRRQMRDIRRHSHEYQGRRRRSKSPPEYARGTLSPEQAARLLRLSEAVHLDQTSPSPTLVRSRHKDPSSHRKLRNHPQSHQRRTSGERSRHSGRPRPSFRSSSSGSDTDTEQDMSSMLSGASNATPESYAPASRRLEASSLQRSSPLEYSPTPSEATNKSRIMEEVDDFPRHHGHPQVRYHAQRQQPHSHQSRHEQVPEPIVPPRRGRDDRRGHQQYHTFYHGR